MTGPRYKNSCQGCDCETGCACSDTYTSAGTGGEGRPCPFTGGEALVIAGGVLTGTPGETIIYDNGPEPGAETDTVTIEAVVMPSDSDGPSTIRLLLGYDAGSYVYGQLQISGGAVTISVGSDGGIMAEEDAGTGGIAEFVTLNLCWNPPVTDGEFDDVVAGAQTVSAGAGWTDASNVLLFFDDIAATTGSLGDDETTSAISVHMFPFLPAQATITRFDMEVRCREAADPANGIEDVSAVFVAGGVTLADKAAFDPIPAPDFAVLTYSWSGGDLTGVTTAAVNTNGVSGGIQFHMPLGSGGGTEPQVDHILLSIHYTAPNITAGRLTLLYTKGEDSYCVSVLDADAAGGGKPGIDFVADTWQVDSVAISCGDGGCEECDNTTHFDCDSDCCDEEGEEDFVYLLLVDGFDSGEWGFTFVIVDADFLLTGPCAWQALVGVSPNFTTFGLYIVEVDGECVWEFRISYNNGGDFARATYRSAAIVDQECDAFPISLSLVQFTTSVGIGDYPSFPASLTVEIP